MADHPLFHRLTPSHRVEAYFVQVSDPNPAGQSGPWETKWSGNDDPDGAKSKRKELQAEGVPGRKVRIVHHTTVSGGSTSIR